MSTNGSSGSQERRRAHPVDTSSDDSNNSSGRSSGSKIFRLRTPTKASPLSSSREKCIRAICSVQAEIAIFLDKPYTDSEKYLRKLNDLKKFIDKCTGILDGASSEVDQKLCETIMIGNAAPQLDAVPTCTVSANAQATAAQQQPGSFVTPEEMELLQLIRSRGWSRTDIINNLIQYSQQ